MRASGKPALCAALVCFMALLAGCSPLEAPAPPAETLSLTLGVGKEPLSALVYAAEHERLFEANGLDVTLIEYDGGGKAAYERLRAGEVDAALCTDAPVVIGALSGARVTVAATVARDPSNIAVLARKSSGIAVPADLRGARIGVQPGTAADFFLHSYLGLNGMSHDAVSISTGSHAEVAASLIAGGLDAAALREPQVSAVTRALGDDLVVFEEPGLYVKTASLCFDPEKPVETEALARLLKALVQAEDLMAGGREDELRKVVVERIGSYPSALDPATYEPGSVSLRQALVLNFEDQARWALSEGLATDTAAFDALALMDPRALDEVAPERVTIIR